MLTVAPPSRLDLSMRQGDDKTVLLRWLATDKVTPIAISSAWAVLRYDDQPPPEGETDPVPGALVRIDSTTPNDPAGWVDSSLWPDGVLSLVVAHELLQAHEGDGNFGRWEAVAVSGAASIRRTLARGEFVVEEGWT